MNDFMSRAAVLKLSPCSRPWEGSICGSSQGAAQTSIELQDPKGNIREERDQPPSLAPLFIGLVGRGNGTVARQSTLANDEKGPRYTTVMDDMRSCFIDCCKIGCHPVTCR